MKRIKDELQDIIFRNEQAGEQSKLKKVQRFLRHYAQTGERAEKQQYLKSEEAAVILGIGASENLLYLASIIERNFIGEGAEQKVYRFSGTHVLKVNSGIFYERWLDYFDSLLVHNYFFPATAYEFLGFKEINGELQAVVVQKFIETAEPTNLDLVREFLEYNGFKNMRNNDYLNLELGLIFEDLHDENVLVRDKILFFIDTIFYLKPEFYKT